MEEEGWLLFYNQVEPVEGIQADMERGLDDSIAEVLHVSSRRAGRLTNKPRRWELKFTRVRSSREEINSLVIHLQGFLLGLMADIDDNFLFR